MTVFIPEYRVKVNGTEVTGVALSGLTTVSYTHLTLPTNREV